MAFFRRRLPHIHEPGRPLFLTWRLHDSLPSNRCFRVEGASSGQAFAAMDQLLDRAQTGPFYLRRPAIAGMVVAAIRFNAEALGQYDLHAYAVMPNHVHLLITPMVSPALLTKSLKGITAKRANAMLGLTGRTFWREESYDHLVRNQREFERIRAYIEENPVRPGLAASAVAFPWSSAAEPTRGSAADEASALPPGAG